MSPAQVDKSQLFRVSAAIAEQLREWYESPPEEEGNSYAVGGDRISQLFRTFMLYQYIEARFTLLDLDLTTWETGVYPERVLQIISLIKKVFSVSCRIEPEAAMYDR